MVPKAAEQGGLRKEKSAASLLNCLIDEETGC